MKLIPAIDIIEGKCVRLAKGNYQQKTIYNSNPLEVAKQFEDAGLQYCHVVDLDGAKANSIQNLKTLETIANKTNLQIDFGGGIKQKKDVENAFSAGAKQVTVGSLAAKQPELFVEWLTEFGSEQLILGADAKQGKIATMGWQTTTSLLVIDFIKNFAKRGAQQVICTDIDKDGMLGGPSIALYKQILQEAPVQLIASGGVTTMKDVELVEKIGCAGVIIGKAIYEGKITLKELSKKC